MRIWEDMLKGMRKKLGSEAGRAPICRDEAYIELKKENLGVKDLGDNFPHVFLKKGYYRERGR